MILENIADKINELCEKINKLDQRLDAIEKLIKPRETYEAQEPFKVTPIL